MEKLRLAILVSLLLGMNLSCGRPISQYYAKLEIGPGFHLVPSQPVSTEPTIGSFYFVDHTATGLTTVHHFRQDLGAKTATRLLYLEANRDLVLDRTVKTFQLMRGRFGTVFADKTCFFNRPTERNWSNVSVHSWFDAPIVEVPSELPRPPKDLPPLTSISLVRIYRASPDYVVVAANYEPTGNSAVCTLVARRMGTGVTSTLIQPLKLDLTTALARVGI